MFLLYFFLYGYGDHRDLHVLTHSYPTRRSSDLSLAGQDQSLSINGLEIVAAALVPCRVPAGSGLTAQRPGPRCTAPWPPETADQPTDAFAPCPLDRKSVGMGKRVSQLVDIGGSRTIKKTNKKPSQNPQQTKQKA